MVLKSWTNSDFYIEMVFDLDSYLVDLVSIWIEMVGCETIFNY